MTERETEIDKIIIEVYSGKVTAAYAGGFVRTFIVDYDMRRVDEIPLQTLSEFKKPKGFIGSQSLGTLKT